MEELAEYQKRKEFDRIVWSWIPRGLGFWAWLGTTIYLWKNELINIDLAATIGLAAGLFIWLLLSFIFSLTGSWLIHTILWENCGCGCLMSVLTHELFQYLGIILLCTWLFYTGTINGTSALLYTVVGIINWFLISYLNM